MEPPSNNSRGDCCWKEVPFWDGGDQSWSGRCPADPSAVVLPPCHNFNCMCGNFNFGNIRLSLYTCNTVYDILYFFHIFYYVHMVSMTILSCDQSSPSLYIQGLIPRNFLRSSELPTILYGLMTFSDLDTPVRWCSLPTGEFCMLFCSLLIFSKKILSGIQPRK